MKLPRKIAEAVEAPKQATSIALVALLIAVSALIVALVGRH